ncbi:F-box/FBD/LRR-repeat protein At1g13570 [Linum grandiflorum]
MNRKVESRSVDRISSLPDDVREHILKFLKVRDAVKSSVLSSKWKTIWTNLSSLHIDGNFVDKRIVGIRENSQIMENLEEILEVTEIPENLAAELGRVVNLHRGPLKEFSLCLPMTEDGIEQILLLLPRETIQSITVVTGFKYPRVPVPVLSSFTKLQTLRLCLCELTSFPVPFDCFNNLEVLELIYVVCPKNQAEWRFVCPFLTTLTLDTCFSPPVIVIEEAPKLSSFDYNGNFISLQFNSTPLLKNVVIHNSCAKWTAKSNLLKANGGLAAVESLSVDGGFYEYLATEEAGNQQPWQKLRHMKLYGVCLSRLSVASSVLRMITNSPNLQQLTLRFWTDVNSVDYKLKNSEDHKAIEVMKSGGDAWKYQVLSRVEVHSLRGTEDEMTLVGWLLNSTPALVCMDIKLSKVLSDAERKVVVDELNGLQTASTGSRIVISIRN